MQRHEVFCDSLTLLWLLSFLCSGLRIRVNSDVTEMILTLNTEKGGREEAFRLDFAEL